MRKKNPEQWSTRRGSIVNPILLLNGLGHRKGERTKSERESWGETRSNGIWGIRDASYVVLPREIFLSSNSLATPSPLCSSRYPLIDIPRQKMRYHGNDTYVSERRNRCFSTTSPPFRPMDHARFYFLEIPQESWDKSARVPDFSGKMYRKCNVFDIMYSMINGKMFWKLQTVDLREKEELQVVRVKY